MSESSDDDRPLAVVKERIVSNSAKKKKIHIDSDIDHNKENAMEVKKSNSERKEKKAIITDSSDDDNVPLSKLKQNVDEKKPTKENHNHKRPRDSSASDGHVDSVEAGSELPSRRMRISLSDDDDGESVTVQQPSDNGNIVESKMEKEKRVSEQMIIDHSSSSDDDIPLSKLRKDNKPDKSSPSDDDAPLSTLKKRETVKDKHALRHSPTDFYSSPAAKSSEVEIEHTETIQTLSVTVGDNNDEKKDVQEKSVPHASSSDDNLPLATLKKSKKPSNIDSRPPRLRISVTSDEEKSEKMKTTPIKIKKKKLSKTKPKKASNKSNDSDSESEIPNTPWARIQRQMKINERLKLEEEQKKQNASDVVSDPDGEKENESLDNETKSSCLDESSTSMESDGPEDKFIHHNDIDRAIDKVLDNGDKKEDKMKKHEEDVTDKKTKVAKEKMSSEEIRIKRLKSMIHLTGRVLPYTKLFATCNSNRQFIRLLEEKLSELGVEKPFTKASCIEWKRKHDEQAELTELMSNKLIQVDGRVTRSKTTPITRKVRRNTSDNEDGNKSDENTEATPPKVDFKRLKGVFESDVDSD